MKIAYLSTFYPLRGGIAQFNASLFRTLEQSHDIKAFTFSRQYPSLLFPGTSQYVQEGDNADPINSIACLDTINPFSYISTAKLINKWQPDMMLMKFWMPFFAPSLGWVAHSTKKHGTKNIAILDNAIPHEKRPGDIALAKYFMNQANGFVVMSDSVRDDLLKLKPNSKYISVNHPLYDHFGNKIDKALAQKELGIPPNKKVLLFFGFIRKYKGLDLLIHALSQLPEEYHLVIAGEVYGEFDEYAMLIKNLGLEDRVSLFVRYISDNEVPFFFSAADVCVLPYKSATQSGIVGISFHFDLPIIATDVGGLKEMLEPYGTGLIAGSPKDYVISKAIIEYFAGDKSEQMKSNISTFKQNCSWDALSKQILDFYNTL